jgi:hypothetical protein
LKRRGNIIVQNFGLRQLVQNLLYNTRLVYRAKDK